MTTGAGQRGALIWLGLGLLLVLSGLCSIFALVATAAQAWQEHAQTRWPEVTARVEDCSLKRTSTGMRKMFHIRCRLSYAVDAREYVANFYSRNVPSPEIWQYPPNQIAPFEEWVNEHPQGTPIAVRYDPADHAKVVMAASYMPGGGPRTKANVKLLGFFVGSFLGLLAIVQIARQRSLRQNGDE